MEVRINANACDSSTYHIARTLLAPLDVISRDLSNNYGGTMNHLWIDFELIEDDAARRPPWPFRFQKRVGGLSPDKLTGLPRGVYENVGHYSVRPDFRHLRSVSHDLVLPYVLELIYQSTSVLLEKQEKLGGFDATKFRSDFLASCRKHGFEVGSGRDPAQQSDGVDRER